MERLDDTGERGPIQPRDARAVVGAYYGLENDHLHQKGREARLLELPRIHFAVKRLAAYPDGRLVDLFARRRPSAHALVLDVEGELPVIDLRLRPSLFPEIRQLRRRKDDVLHDRIRPAPNEVVEPTEGRRHGGRLNWLRRRGLDGWRPVPTGEKALDRFMRGLSEDLEHPDHGARLARPGRAGDAPVAPSPTPVSLKS